jgi:hypothetical protein
MRQCCMTVWHGIQIHALLLLEAVCIGSSTQEEEVLLGVSCILQLHAQHTNILV